MAFLSASTDRRISSYPVGLAKILGGSILLRNTGHGLGPSSLCAALTSLVLCSVHTGYCSLSRFSASSLSLRLPLGGPSPCHSLKPSEAESRASCRLTTLLCLLATVFKTVVSYGLSCPRFFSSFFVGISSGRVNLVLLSRLG